MGREPARLVLLRGSSEGVPDPLRGEVDEALRQAITTQTRFGTTADSPIPFDDIELAAGCVARDADCMRRISATLGDDWFMIRELSHDSSGRVYLALTAHDGPRAEVTRRAVAEVAESGDRVAARVVPSLVDRLYPAQRPERAGARPALASPAHAGPSARAARVPAASTASAPPAAVADGRARQPQAPQAAAPRRPSRGNARTAAAVAGWTTTVLGGGLLAGGVALGALSRADHRSYERTPLTSPADVDRADELLERARSRARTANMLLIGGAATSAVGIVTLLWSYLQPRAETRSMALKVAPVRGGAALSLKGTWRGGI